MKTYAARLAVGVAAIVASLLAATDTAGARPAQSTALGRITCAGTTGFDKSAHGMTLIGGRVGGLRRSGVVGTTSSDDPTLVTWSKIPIVVKAGTKPFTIKLDPSQQKVAAMTWNPMRDDATGVRVVPCSKAYADATYSWYAGGFFATKPMCLHLIVDLGNRKVRVGMPFGARC